MNAFVTDQNLSIWLIDKVAIDGKVIHRAECRPIDGDARYMELKK